MHSVDLWCMHSLQILGFNTPITLLVGSSSIQQYCLWNDKWGRWHYRNQLMDESFEIVIHLVKNFLQFRHLFGRILYITWYDCWRGKFDLLNHFYNWGHGFLHIYKLLLMPLGFIHYVKHDAWDPLLFTMGWCNLPNLVGSQYDSLF